MLRIGGCLESQKHGIFLSFFLEREDEKLKTGHMQNNMPNTGSEAQFRYNPFQCFFVQCTHSEGMRVATHIYTELGAIAGRGSQHNKAKQGCYNGRQLFNE